MSEMMTQKFVYSFLETCFDAGLSKEAAAELLQKESVDQEKQARPAFARGYEKAASQAPGGLCPMIFINGELEKSAASPRFDIIKGILGGIKDIVKNTGKGVIQGTDDVVTGVGKVMSPAARNPNALVHKAPFPVALGMTALGGAGALGIHNLMSDNHGISGPMDPFFSPSGYSPGEYDARMQERLDKDYGPGIAKHNKEYYGSFGRRKELEKAIAEGKGGSAAYQELRELNKKHSQLEKQRNSHFEQLEASGDQHRQNLERIHKRQNTLEDRRTSIWGLPQRAWLRMTGRNPSEYYDKEIGMLQGRAAQATMGSTLAGRRTNMMHGGYTAPTTQKKPSPVDLQAKFFPTFGQV